MCRFIPKKIMQDFGLEVGNMLENQQKVECFTSYIFFQFLKGDNWILRGKIQFPLPRHETLHSNTKSHKHHDVHINIAIMSCHHEALLV